MEKLKMETPDLAQSNIEKISELFPNCVTEAVDENGKLKKVINFELLKQMLSGDVIDGDEAYEFTWVGKKAAIVEVNRPTRKTLRPCPEESKDWDTTENLYIEGDNLEVLKLLQESYLGKVKMIYIDPPYNTGNDFIYRDNFYINSNDYEEQLGVLDKEENRLFKNTDSNGRFHSDWCSMIYARLMLARNFLTNDGIIFISIDENEVDNLKKICNEVFGASNYAGEIIWKNSSKNDQAYISIQHEYIICYVKDKQSNTGEWVEKKEGTDEIFKAFEDFKKQYGNDWKAIHKAALEWYKQFSQSNPIYASKHYSWMDERGVYFPDNISGPNSGQYVYDIKHPVTGKTCKAPSSGWRFPEATLLQKIDEGLIHFGDDETTVPNKKTYLKDTLYQSLGSVKYQDGRIASKQLAALMGGNFFNNPKDVSIICWLMSAVGIGNDDIIMDFFAGSATTAHSVMEFNLQNMKCCKFIMIQIPENLDETLDTAIGGSKTIVRDAIKHLDSMGKPHLLTEISKERIFRAGEKIKMDKPSIAQNIDIGFRVFKLDESNMNDVYYSAGEYNQDMLSKLESNIKHDRTDLDLLFGCLLEWGLPLSMPYTSEQIEGCTVHTYNDGDLIACFDESIPDSVIKEIAKRQPLRVVFRDNSFNGSPEKINVGEIFKMLAPDTRVKVI